MEDLFAREQQILEHAQAYSEVAQAQGFCAAQEYSIVVKEYRRLLKQLRRITKISDKKTVDLYVSNLDLLDQIHYDELTGIYSRRFLMEGLSRTLPALSETGERLSLLMIDVDHFKCFNDTYGHSAGDECLRLLANTFQSSLSRKEDFAARYGGEEFVVALPGMDEVEAQRVALRILQRVRALGLPHRSSATAPYVTVSVGVTTGRADAAHTVEEYIVQVDKALYQSKQTGRDRSTFLRLGSPGEGKGEGL